MPKRSPLTLILLVLLLVVTLQPIQAQSEIPKLEWGVQFSALRFSDFTTWDKGVGSRITYILTRRVSLEAEGNVFFSQDAFLPDIRQSFFVGERRVQGLFGAKAGQRWRRFGVFGKLRPGFIHFSEQDCPAGKSDSGNCFGELIPGSPCRLDDGSLAPCPQSLKEQTKFALDLGGVIEFYPSRRFALRIDLGDTLIRNSQPGQTSHNLQISSGLSLHF